MADEKQPTPKYPDHSNLLEVRDATGRATSVRTIEDWTRRRAHILVGMQEVMGPLPTQRVPLEMKILETTDNDDFTLYRLEFSPEPGDRVPALLLIPQGLQAKAPGVLCLHQTTAVGKKEPAGLAGLDSLHYAQELARRKFVCLAPDYPSFGDYQYDFAKDRYISGTMKGIWNHTRAVDLLCELPDVDPAKIGCIGHSLGGHNTLFVSAFDPRIKALASSCGFCAFGKYYGGDLRGWSSDRYMPKILSYGGWKNLPFDFHEVVGAIAPRAFLAVAPLRDSNFDVEGVREVMRSAGDVYRLYGAADRLAARYPDAGHEFTRGERENAYDFLRRHLT